MTEPKQCPIAARKADVLKWLKESVEDCCWHEPDVGIWGDSELAAAFMKLIDIVNTRPRVGYRTTYQRKDTAALPGLRSR